MRGGAYYCQDWQKVFIKATLILSCSSSLFFLGNAGEILCVCVLLKNKEKTAEMVGGKGRKFKFSDG